MDQLSRPSTISVGSRQSSMRGPFVLGTAAAAWLGVALLTVLWPDHSGTDWDYTGELAAGFGVFGGVLAVSALAGLRFGCLPRLTRPAPWMLALALLLGTWETVTAKLGLLP